MKRIKQHKLLLAGTLLLLLGSTTQAEVIFTDGFESGNLAESNTEGFAWSHPNRTSLVMQHPTNGNMVVMKGNGEPATPPDNIVNDGLDWTAYEGDISMRFRYPAGEPWAEQRFRLGTAYPEIWFSFWLRVPTNFSHGEGSRTNHKMFAVWMDGYEVHGDGPTAVWEFWNSGANGSRVIVRYTNEKNSILTAHLQSKPFIAFPSDQGRWMQLVFHLKAATNDGSNDGVLEMWRRWENETDYTQMHQLTDANIAPPDNGPDGWANGYLLGWANAPYAEDTEWLLDSFTVSTSSLLTNITPPSAPMLSIE